MAEITRVLNAVIVRVGVRPGRMVDIFSGRMVDTQ